MIKKRSDKINVYRINMRTAPTILFEALSLNLSLIAREDQEDFF